MIISLGSGSGSTEMNSKLPCLCIDNDKRAVFAGIVNLKGNWLKKKSGVYHAYYDIKNGKGIYQIVSRLKIEFPSLKIRILFQHPNPSLSQTYSNPGFFCVQALKNKIIQDIHFVYDMKKGSNCCSKEKLLDMFLYDVNNKEDLVIGDELLISEIVDTNVNHPIFGHATRMGWAEMRHACEYTFKLTY